MDENYPLLALPDKESTDGFLDKYQGQSRGLYNAIAPLREFSRYLIKIVFQNTYVVPPKQMPRLHPEPPYFFSEDELPAFFQECDTYFSGTPGPRARGIVIPAQFRLLHCCGLRTKEARILPVSDVHLDKKYINITQSKGSKSRRIYISDELTLYLLRYNYQVADIFPDRTYFFPGSAAEPYSVNTVGYNFEVIWKRTFSGWPGKIPRIYDFRHHSAWTNINRWAREGKDVNAMLPYLMRYMGHNCIKLVLDYSRNAGKKRIGERRVSVRMTVDNFGDRDGNVHPYPP